MRLVVVTNILAPYRVPLFNELAQRGGVQLRVMLRSRNETGRQWDWPEDIRFQYRVALRETAARGSAGLLAFGPRMMWDIVRLRPDVVIAGGMALGYPAWLAARAVGARFYTWSEATLASERAATATWRWPVKAALARLADGCIASSTSTADYFAALGVPRRKIHTSLLAIDVEGFARAVAAARRRRTSIRRELALGGTVFLYAGRLEPCKGVDLLLDSFVSALGEGADARLLLVGDGSLRSGLEARARTDAPGRVVFAGFHQPDHLAAFYAASDVFCLFSRQEPFGAVLAEALAAGLPVVASRGAGATGDLVAEGANGFIIDPDDTLACASVLSRLARDAEARTGMGDASRSRAALCSPQAAVDAILAAVRFEPPIGSGRGMC